MMSLVQGGCSGGLAPWEVPQKGDIFSRFHVFGWVLLLGFPFGAGNLFFLVFFPAQCSLCPQCQTPNKGQEEAGCKSPLYSEYKMGGRLRAPQGGELVREAHPMDLATTSGTFRPGRGAPGGDKGTTNSPRVRWGGPESQRAMAGWWRGGAQFLNMSQSSFSMGVLPMVRRKKSSSTRSEERKRSAGRSSSSFPNLGDRGGGGGWCHHPQCPQHPLGMGTAVPDGLPRVVGAVVLAQHHL